MAGFVELRVQNFRKIVALEIRPDGDLVVISGPNEAGKTSVLHSIWALLKGRAVAGPTPIRLGAEQCTIQGRTAEFTATRTFKMVGDAELTTDLKIVMADGRRITSKPQAMLDAMLPDLALDPLDFMRRPLKDRLDTLKALVKGFDFAGNAAARKRLFEARTTANRRADDAQAAADAIVLPAGPVPKAIDVTDLLDQMQSAAQHNATLETRRAGREQAQRDIDAKLDEAEQLRARASTLERDAKALQDKLAGAAALPGPVDVEALRVQIAAAEQVKGVRGLHETRRSHEGQHKTQADESDRLTREIAALDAAKTAAIVGAKLPVDGLEFDDEQILLGGVPFESASLAQKLRASVGIGMALCPPPEDPALRLMTIDEGSELDSKSMALLRDLARQHQYQIWLARVDESGEQGFVIVDGALAEGV